MSYHWENVIWQSKDGNWNRGYFHRISMGSGNWEDDGYDSEWDDEFDQSYFDYVATGMPSLEAAWDYKPHGNPGSATEVPYAGNSKQCKHYDLMAHWFKNPGERAKFERKEHLRKVREHFKELSIKWTPEAVEGLLVGFHYLKLELKGDAKVYERWGVSSTVTGYPQKTGDWLTLKDERVYNLKARKFHERVRSLELNPSYR